MAEAPGGGPRRPRRLAVLLHGGTYDRAHYALAAAAAAAAIDRPVTLFVTLGATRAFLAPAGGDGAPGWARLPLSPEFREPPGCADGAGLDARYRARGVAGFEELLAACRDLGVRVMVCEMGLRALGVGADALRPDLTFEPGGLATLLGEGGDLLTF